MQDFGYSHRRCFFHLQVGRNGVGKTMQQQALIGTGNAFSTVEVHNVVLRESACSLSS